MSAKTADLVKLAHRLDRRSETPAARSLRCTKCGKGGGRQGRAIRTKLQPDGTLVHTPHGRVCDGVVEPVANGHTKKLDHVPATDSKYDGVAADRLQREPRGRPGGGGRPQGPRASERRRQGPQQARRAHPSSPAGIHRPRRLERLGGAPPGPACRGPPRDGVAGRGRHAPGRPRPGGVSS